MFHDSAPNPERLVHDLLWDNPLGPKIKTFPRPHSSFMPGKLLEQISVAGGRFMNPSSEVLETKARFRVQTTIVGIGAVDRQTCGAILVFRASICPTVPRIRQ